MKASRNLPRFTFATDTHQADAGLLDRGLPTADRAIGDGNDVRDANFRHDGRNLFA
jgi:hypothetical protein